MPGTLYLYDGGRNWASLELTNINAVGRLNPRLQLFFSGHAIKHLRVQLKNVWLGLEHHNELVGGGRVQIAEPNENDASGDDAAVFLYLRGSLDSLLGAKTAILDAISDELKRDHLNRILTAAGKFRPRGIRYGLVRTVSAGAAEQVPA